MLLLERLIPSTSGSSTPLLFLLTISVVFWYPAWLIYLRHTPFLLTSNQHLHIKNGG